MDVLQAERNRLSIQADEFSEHLVRMEATAGDEDLYKQEIRRFVNRIWGVTFEAEQEPVAEPVASVSAEKDPGRRPPQPKGPQVDSVDLGATGSTASRFHQSGDATAAYRAPTGREVDASKMAPKRPSQAPNTSG